MNRTKINQKAVRELKKLFTAKGITRCEVCNTDFGLTFAHRHKRRWYYDKPDELLWDFKQVLLTCLSCHQILEQNALLTGEEFLIRRGGDNAL